MAERTPPEEQLMGTAGWQFDVHARCRLLPQSNPSTWFLGSPYAAIEFIFSDTQVYAAFSLLQSYVASTFRSASGRELTQGEYDDILARTAHLPPAHQARILEYFYAMYRRPQVVAPPDPTPDELQATALCRYILDHRLSRSTDYSHHGRHFATCIKQFLMGLPFGQTIQEVLWTRETDGEWASYGVADDILHGFPGDFTWTDARELTYANTGPVPPRKFITWAFDSYFENPNGVSLFAKLAWPVYFAWSANDTGNLALNRYHAPFLDVAIAADKKNLKARIDDWMKRLPLMRSFAGAAHANDEVVTPITGMTAGSFEDFASAVRLQYRQISKVILGSALALEEGESGSLALAQSTAAPALRAIVQDLVNAVNETYTRTLLSWVTLWNFPAGTRPPSLELTLPEQVIPPTNATTTPNSGNSAGTGNAARE